MIRNIPRVFIVLAAAGLNVHLIAQEPAPVQQQEKQEKPEKKLVQQAQEIVVVATRNEANPYDVPQATDVITAQELKERQPATFGDALRGNPGVWLTESGSGRGKTPIIRGLTGSQILTLVDGRRLNNALLPPAGPFSMHDTIDPEDIERIEILRGPGSVLFGTGAIGGIVNVVPKAPPAFSNEGVFNTELRLRGSSADTGFRQRLVVEGADANSSFRVGGSYTSLGDLRAGGGEILSPLSQQTRNYDATYLLGISDTASLRFRVDLSELDSGPDYLKPTTPSSSEIDRAGFSASLLDNGSFEMADKLEVKLWNSYWESVDDRSDILKRRTRTTNTYGLDINANKSIGRGHRLSYGFQTYLDQTEDLSELAAGNEKGIPDGSQLSTALYAQDEYDVGDDVVVFAGVRANYFRTNTSPEAATTPAGFTASDLDISKANLALTGSLGLIADIGNDFSIASNLGRGFRVPGISELAGVKAHPDGVSVGTPTLSPEESLTLDLSVRYEGNKVRGSVTGFHTWLRNMITSEPGSLNGSNFVDRDSDGIADPNEMVSVRTNSGRAAMTGTEAEATWQFTEAWSLGGSFSWVIGSDYEADEPMRFVAPAYGSMTLRFDDVAEGRWWSEFQVTAVRKQDRIPDSLYFSRADYLKDPQDPGQGFLRETSVLPGYTLFSLRAGTELGRDSSLVVAVENAGDKNYRPLGARHDGAGVNFILTFEQRF